MRFVAAFVSLGIVFGIGLAIVQGAEPPAKTHVAAAATADTGTGMRLN